MRKFAGITLIVICSMFLAWGFVSWGEIVIKNIQGAPSYCALNLFKIFLNI